jgi:hypothetical protein
MQDLWATPNMLIFVLPKWIPHHHQNEISQWKEGKKKREGGKRDI